MGNVLKRIESAHDQGSRGANARGLKLENTVIQPMKNPGYGLSLLSTGVNAGGWAFAAFSTNITAEWAGRFRDYSTADGC